MLDTKVSLAPPQKNEGSVVLDSVDVVAASIPPTVLRLTEERAATTRR